MKKQAKLKKALKKVQKILKLINNFIKVTIKNYKSMKTKIKACIMACLIFLTSCGVTKASISKPAAGTYTTITITTNNPITTDVKPQTDVKL